MVFVTLTELDCRKWCGTAHKCKKVDETSPDRLRLKQGLTSLTVWDGRKQHGTAKNGKNVNETQPDRLRLKHNFHTVFKIFPG